MRFWKNKCNFLLIFYEMYGIIIRFRNLHQEILARICASLMSAKGSTFAAELERKQ